MTTNLIISHTIQINVQLQEGHCSCSKYMQENGCICQSKLCPCQTSSSQNSAPVPCQTGSMTTAVRTLPLSDRQHDNSSQNSAPVRPTAWQQQPELCPCPLADWQHDNSSQNSAPVRLAAWQQQSELCPCQTASMTTAVRTLPLSPVSMTTAVRTLPLSDRQHDDGYLLQARLLHNNLRRQYWQWRFQWQGSFSAAWATQSAGRPSCSSLEFALEPLKWRRRKASGTREILLLWKCHVSNFAFPGLSQMKFDCYFSWDCHHWIPHLN